MKALLLTLLLMMGSVNAASYIPPFQLSSFQLAIACVLVDQQVEETISCKNVSPPWIITTANLRNFSDTSTIHGMYYPGEKQVFVNALSPNYKTLILHEVVHYILWANGFVGDEGRCNREEIARAVAEQEWSDESKKINRCPVDD